MAWNDGEISEVWKGVFWGNGGEGMRGEGVFGNHRRGNCDKWG